MNNSKYLTILLCTYNRAKLLKALLDELINQVTDLNRNDIEILLIDNNSNDETKNVVQNFQKTCNFLIYEFEGRQGLAKARNKGLVIAKGKVIVFIDDDIVLEKTWLSEILISLKMYPYKAFGGRVIPLWEKEKPNYINLSGTFAISQKVFPAHDNGNSEKIYPINKEETNPIGANMWFYKELFEKYGEFREDLGRVGYGGIPCEDTEFCSRLLKNKEIILYYPKAIVYHPVSTYRMSKEFIRSWHYRNGISSVRKGGRTLPMLDIGRFLVRLLILLPFYILGYCTGLIILNRKLLAWSEFKAIRILGQSREFFRIWLKIPLKDPVF